MKNKSGYVLNIVVFLLVLMWTYASFSKLFEFNLFRSQMHKQVLPDFIKSSIMYWLPAMELMVAMSLFFEHSRLTGLYVSLLLMSIFTGYVGLIYFHFFPRVPCSCGGVISALDWGGHLLFNTFYLLLTGLGIYMVNRERRLPAKFTGL